MMLLVTICMKAKTLYYVTISIATHIITICAITHTMH